MAVTRLPVTVMCQEQTEWCWAACAEAVSATYTASPLSQCQIVGRVKQDPDCCSHPSQLNVQGSLQEATDDLGLACRVVNGRSLEFDDVAQHIVGRARPVGARIQDRENGLAHNVLVVGCDPADTSVLVCDPWGTIGTAVTTWSMPFQTFKNSYGEQAWGWCSHAFFIG